MLGVLVESDPPEKLPFALLGCGRTLCLLNTLWLLWLSGLASTSWSDPGGTIYSTPGIAMVLEVEEYGDPAILMVIFRAGASAAGLAAAMSVAFCDRRSILRLDGCCLGTLVALW